MTDPNDLGPAAPIPPRRQPARPSAPRPVPEIRYASTPAPTPGTLTLTVPPWVKPVAIGLAYLVGTFLVMLLVARIVYPPSPDGPTPTPTPVADGVELGRTFAPPLALALADGFDAEAEAMEKGKTVGEADAALKEKFKESLNGAFKAHSDSTFAALVPKGEEPKDDATRKRFAQLHRDFAAGLRKGARR